MRAKLFILLQHIIPQHLLSRTMHKLTRVKSTWLKNAVIKNFIKLYKIDMSDYGNKTEQDFISFNEFFTRPLIEGARSIEADALKLASPVDGTLSQCGPINKGQLIQAKGMQYSARRLLGNAQWANTYIDGNFCCIYLAPNNYHRIHMPCNGTLTKMSYIPGKLFSVNLTTADNVDALFARNERVVCEFDTEHGKLIMALIGAVFVGSIETVWAGEITPAKPRTGFTKNYTDQSLTFERGEEMARFNMGSTVILLSDNQKMHFDSSVSVVQLGEAIARLSEIATIDEEE